jgi:thiol-disulfide isomerase/thioredoxin
MRSRRHRALALALAGALVVVAAAGCSHGSSFDSQTPAAKVVNASEASMLPQTADALPDIDYDRFQELGRQLAGVPVVVNIWSSWCGPCRSEAADLAAAASQYGDDVQFLGVDILDSRSDAAAFIRHYGWPYPSVFNASGDIRDQLGFIGQPETVFYDADGEVVATWIGPIDQAELNSRLAELAGSDG